jgi:uncharacterized protein HemX
VKTRSVTETAILSASALIALIVVVAGARNINGKGAGVLIAAVTILAGIGMVMWFRQNSRESTAKTELSSGAEYRQLAEECRRLAEMAVTAQEHTDLRLSEVAVQMDQMRAQLDSVRKILVDVE